MRRGLPAYALVSGLVVSASAAALSRPAGLARCLQPVFLSRASFCGSLPQSDALVPVAVVFGAGLILAISPRAAFVVSLVALNLLFAWTARVLLAVSPILGMGVSRLVDIQARAVWSPLGLGGLSQLSAIATDLEGLSLLAAVSLLVAWQTRGRGMVRSALLGLWTAAACLTILAAEVAMFDSGALSSHVTTFQALLGLAPWLTNARLLESATLSLAAVSVLFGWRARSATP